MMTKIKHLYVHVPFCKTICFYCDFCHKVYDTKLVKKWLETLSLEIKDKLDNQYETIYIGGGTPSSLNNEELESLLKMLEPYSKNVLEYTIEVNPESLDLEKINIFKKYHINRISMGVQSSDDRLLNMMNRKHTFIDVKEKIKLLKDNGINNISIDLMYSLPNQDIKTLDKTLDDFLSLDVPHVSLYSLTIEDNTVFALKGYKPLNDEIEADMYELICQKLEKNAYRRYEVSNFSKTSYESKHNLAYWNYEDFIGISLGASSKINNHRYTNTKDFDKYFNNYNTKDEELILNNEELAFENIMMSLRTIYGLDIKEFTNKYKIDFINHYKKGINNKNIKVIDNRVVCTNLAILNSVLIDFMD